MSTIHDKYKNPTLLDAFHFCELFDAYRIEIKKALLANTNKLQLLKHILMNHSDNGPIIGIVKDELIKIYGAPTYSDFTNVMEREDRNDMAFELIISNYDILDYTHYINNAERYTHSWRDIYDNAREATLVRLFISHTAMIGDVREYLRTC